MTYFPRNTVALANELQRLSGWQFDETPNYSVTLLLVNLAVVFISTTAYDARRYSLRLEYSPIKLLWKASYPGWCKAIHGDTAKDALMKLGIKVFNEGSRTEGEI